MAGVAPLGSSPQAGDQGLGGPGQSPSKGYSPPASRTSALSSSAVVETPILPHSARRAGFNYEQARRDFEQARRAAQQQTPTLFESKRHLSWTGLASRQGRGLGSHIPDGRGRDSVDDLDDWLDRPAFSVPGAAGLGGGFGGQRPGTGRIDGERNDALLGRLEQQRAEIERHKSHIDQMTEEREALQREVQRLTTALHDEQQRSARACAERDRACAEREQQTQLLVSERRQHATEMAAKSHRPAASAPAASTPGSPPSSQALAAHLRVLAASHPGPAVAHSAAATSGDTAGKSAPAPPAKPAFLSQHCSDVEATSRGAQAKKAETSAEGKEKSTEQGKAVVSGGCAEGSGEETKGTLMIPIHDLKIGRKRVLEEGVAGREGGVEVELGPLQHAMKLPRGTAASSVAVAGTGMTPTEAVTDSGVWREKKAVSAVRTDNASVAKVEAAEAKFAQKGFSFLSPSWWGL